MLNSVLLHLEGPAQAESVIRVGVVLARESAARLRGLTLLDTRRTEEATQGEAAVYVVLEQTRQACIEQGQETVRECLSHACLAAGLNFDVRHSSGNPLKVLPREAQFHDLVITAVCPKGTNESSRANLSPSDLMDLLRRGVQPLMVVHTQLRTINRVLLVYDGSEASGRAIRTFLSQGICAEADHRLLSIGANERAASLALREMADYCLARCPTLETGYACGRGRAVLSAYVQKWQADLVVMGAAPSHRLLYGLLGNKALDLLNQQVCAVYVAS